MERKSTISDTRSATPAPSRRAPPPRRSGRSARSRHRRPAARALLPQAPLDALAHGATAAMAATPEDHAAQEDAEAPQPAAQLAPAPPVASFAATAGSCRRLRLGRSARHPADHPVAARARSGAWVTSTSVAPCFSRSPNSRSTIAAPLAPSRLPVGSSASRMSGAAPRRAPAPRAAARRPTAARGSAPSAPPARRRQLLLGAVEGVGVPGQFQRRRDVFQRGHRRDQVEGLEHHAEMIARKPGQRVLVHRGQVVSERLTVPPVARSSPPISISSDDLPEPDGPTSPSVSPRWTSSVIASSIHGARHCPEA